MIDCNCELCVHLRTAPPKAKSADLSPEQVVADIKSVFESGRPVAPARDVPIDNREA